MGTSRLPSAVALHLVVVSGDVPARNVDAGSPFGFELTPRPHLQELFQTVVRHTVTALEAPLGFGKTAALWLWYSQARDKGMDALWLSLSETGTDPGQFLQRLHHALRGMNSSSEGISAPHDVQSFVAAWSGLHRPCLILLDDYPVEGTALLDAALGALLCDAPPSMHFVVASRGPVEWPLYKLVIEGRGQRLGREQLRFSREEVERYLAAGDVRADVLQTVEDVLRGWPIALHILRLSREREPQADLAELVRRPPQLAVGYVREQILRELPPPVADFLLETAMLDRISAPLADAMRGTDDSHVMLLMAAHRGVPISADAGETVWHEVHPLVRACLRVESAGLGEVRLKELNLRALDWLSAHGTPEEAARHARLTGDAERIRQLFGDAGAVRTAMRHGTPTLGRMLEQIPLGWMHRFPRVQVARAFLFVKAGRFQEARHVLESARASQRVSGEAADADLERDIMLAEIYLNNHEDRPLPSRLEDTEFQRLMDGTPANEPGMKGFLNFFLRFRVHYRRGRFAQALEAAAEAEFWYREANQSYGVMFVVLVNGLLLLRQGRLRVARECFARSEEIATKQFPAEQQGQILPGLLNALVHYELNDMDTASRLLARYLPRIEDTQVWADGYILTHVTASFLEYHQRGVDAALEIVARGHATGERRRFPRLACAMNLQRAELLARAGRTDEALAQLAQSGIRGAEDCLKWEDDFTWGERHMAALALARVHLLRGDAPACLEIAATFAAECQEAGALYYLLRYRLLQALAWREHGKRQESIAALQAALAIGGPEDASRAFLDEGAPMLDLLKDAMRGTVAEPPSQTAEFVAALVTAFANDGAGAARVRNVSILSPREYDVLLGLVRGQSNKVIARQLNLTENTVKFHLRRIYEKLGVSSRGMAAAVAREMGLFGQPAPDR
jgi:LuxR family transcriptional regulator, maltose regulon positive regulatory protein